MTKFLLILYIFVGSGCVVAPMAKKKVITHNTMRNKVKATIVIDPGHGGEDSGALGKNGLKEKDLSLDIALRITRLLKLVMPEVKVILTRTHDQSVSLEERIAIAHKAQGDIFISVHINSSDQESARGFEIYSLDVASDKHAERLAARENKSLKTNSGVNFILADLRAHDHRYESDQLARFISQGLSSQVSKKLAYAGMNNRGYNQAVFQVLFVKMPAVLAEFFFISNPEEERLLKTEAMRESCARGTVAGISKYFDQRIARAQNASAHE